MYGMSSRGEIRTVSLLCSLVLLMLIAAYPAHAGAPYTCDPRDVHQFWNCVNPEKPPPQPCQPSAGNPVDVLSGRKHQEVLDWSSGGGQPLELKRFYSSSPFMLAASPYSSLGKGWRTNFDARARWRGSSIDQADWVHIVLPDHFEYHFNKQGDVWQAMLPLAPLASVYASDVRWQSRSDLNASVTIDGKWIVFRAPDDTVYVFDTADHTPDYQWFNDHLRVSLLSEIRFPSGYVQKLSFSLEYLVKVTDNLGRWIEFDYSPAGTRSVLVSQARSSDGQVIRYTYENRFAGVYYDAPVDYWALSTVTYPDATPETFTDNPKVKYEYLNVAGKPGLLLTGMVDERRVRFASWTYNGQGQTLSSEHAGGADRWQFAYDDAGRSVTVTNPLGRSTVYRYVTVAGSLRQLVSVDGVATSSCAASNTKYSYDLNGFRSRAVDAEGRVTTWTRDPQGRPLTMTEAAGTSVARTTAMNWSPGLSRPLNIREPSLESTFAYDATGQVTSVTRVDRSSQVGSSGARTVSYAYATFRSDIQPVPKPTGAALEDVPLPVADYLNTTQSQDIVVPSQLLAQVDQGLRAIRMSWLQTGEKEGGLQLYFVNAAGTEFEANMSDWVTFPRSRILEGPVPAGTRIIRVKGQSIGYSVAFQNISLKLIADGAASENPYLRFYNSAGLSGLAGWTTLEGVMNAGPPCGLNPCFWNVGNAPATLSQVVAIPADRFAEIDRGDRALEVQWLDGLLGGIGYLGATAEFLDASGRLVTNGAKAAPEVAVWSYARHSARFDPVPAKARSVRVSFKIIQAIGNNITIGLQTFSARLVPRSAVASPIKLLTSVDGPLPGPSDTVRYAYGSGGNVMFVVNELGQVTRITRRDAGARPLSVTDPNGVVTNMTYDPRGRLASVTVNPGAGQARTIIAYDAAGQVTRVTSPDGSFLSYTWSESRRLTSVVNNAGERITYGYNANGDVTSRTVRSASGAIERQQSALFDELGRLLRSIGAAGQQTLFQYDRTDNLTAVQDPRGGLFAYAYDGLQNLASLTDQAGSQVRLTRDGQGKITAYADPRGITTTYVRNGFGEVIQESGPDVGTTVIERDERGLPVRITDPRGVVTTLAYDAAGRLVQEAKPADPRENVTYSYDNTDDGNKGIGRLTGITDQSGSTARRYDALGRVVAERRVISGNAYNVTYGYNAAGRLTSITYPSGRVVTYARSPLGRIVAVTMQNSASAQSQAVAAGVSWSPMSSRLADLTFGNGLVSRRLYDDDGRIAGLSLLDGARAVDSLSYGYDDGMNLTAVNDNVAPGNSLRLAYDAAQRLVSAQGPWGNIAYAYTASGDRSREVFTRPSGGKLTTLLSYPANSNRLTKTSLESFTTRSFTYDAAGNLLTQVMGPLQLSFSYNLRNRPVTVTRTGDGTQVSNYLFNALEQLVQRSTTAPGGPSGAVHYIYALDGSLLAEADASTGATLRDYIWLPAGDVSPAADNDNEEGASALPLPLGLVTGVNTAAPQLLMVHADHLGRPVRLTDAARTSVWTASYIPTGQPWKLTGTVEQNLRFPGQYFLLETALAYNWHRFYDPATGRYTQPDPLRFVDGPSVYGYAGGSPLMRVDPEGLSAFCTIFGIGCNEPPHGGPPICADPSNDHAKEECEKAAEGNDDDWENFCLSSRWMGNVDRTRSQRCRRYALSGETEKKNFCFNEFGD